VDRASLGLALQQLNTHLQQEGEPQRGGLPNDLRALLQERFGLDKGDLNEVESNTFTALDAYHVELCCLLRDAVRSLGVEQATPAERAAAGFAWVIRQVFLQEQEGAPVPPELVLRRGWGTARERAHVFLALLHQLGLPGCLITSSGLEQPWACGAVVHRHTDEKKEPMILLFDHRLGVPVPGGKGAPDSELARAFRLALPVRGRPDGQEIATLALVRKQPEVLAVLTVEEKHRYDVSPDQAKQADIELAVPLSAMAPRMHVLQTQLMPPGANLRLAADPRELLPQVTAAAAGTGASVRIRRDAAGILRRFLPEQEGGSDKGDRMRDFVVTLVPLHTMPRILRSVEGEDAQRRITTRFSEPFLVFLMEPKQPRDLLLRGRLKEAAETITRNLDELRVQKSRLETNPEVRDQFVRWQKDLEQAYVGLYRAEEAARKGGSREAITAARAHLEQMWKSGQVPLVVLTDGSSAEPRRAQASFMQGLCMFEQALQGQRRAEQLAALPEGTADSRQLAAARSNAVTAWNESASWLDQYLGDYPESPFSAQARLLLAATQEALGHGERTQRLLQDSTDGLDPFDRMARLYLVRRLQSK
jgi:hypothetical protein